jgi:hypothetical protein
MSDPDTGQLAMEALERQWYNTVVVGLGRDPNTFQLLRPTTPLGATSDKLWAYFNNIPPRSLTNNFTYSGGNRFYDNYRAVVSQLLAPGLVEFENYLGDAAPKWNAYLKELKPAPELRKLSQIFEEWAMLNGYVGIAAQGANELAALANNPVIRAQRAAADEKEFIGGVPNFSGGIDTLRAAVFRASKSSFQFDNRTAKSDASKTWAQGSVSGVFDFFNGGASARFAEMSARALTSQLTVKVQFEHLTTFGAGPGSWYSSAALSTAYNKADNYTWRVGGTPDWQSTFGPSGNLLRFVASLVVADGLSLTLESGASFDRAEQQEIKAHASAGFWPFFSAQASGGHETQANFSSDGRMVVKSETVAGNPFVFGVNVLPVAAYIAAQPPTV